MRPQHTADLRVDVDGLHRRAARQAALVDDTADCVAELRAGGFGEWWRDGRPNDLAARIESIADRLDTAGVDVGRFTDGLRRRIDDLSDADGLAWR